MKRLGLAAAAIVLLGLGCAAILSIGPPFSMRTRLHHFLHVDGMNQLATALVNNPEEFEWVAMTDGRVVAGRGGIQLPEPEVSPDARNRLRPLFHEASLYYLLSFKTARGRGAGAQLSTGRESGKDYSVSIFYRSDPRPSRGPCEAGYLDSDLGHCFVRLDENWIYELSWYDPDHMDEVLMQKRGSERRITIP